MRTISAALMAVACIIGADGTSAPAAQARRDPGARAETGGAAERHGRGVEFHLQRRLDEAAREYDEALALDPPRQPTADERALMLRFAPRVFTAADEFFPLKDAASILHPSERLVAYHLFWEDDIDFPEDNDPCDHEVVWVQFSQDRRTLERFWTYFHGRILDGGADAIADAAQHGMRPRVNVQWGKHGSLPVRWESMSIVPDNGDLERAFYGVGKPITLAEYNRGTWQKLHSEGRRLRDHPMARRLGWPERFTGEWSRFVEFSREIDLRGAIGKPGLMAVSRWNSAVIARHFLPYNFRPKTEWPPLNLESRN